MAALAVVCAVAVPVAMASASTAIDRQATMTLPESIAPVRATVRVSGAAAVAATSTAQGFLGLATEVTTIPSLSGPAADPTLPSFTC